MRLPPERYCTSSLLKSSILQLLRPCHACYSVCKYEYFSSSSSSSSFTLSHTHIAKDTEGILALVAEPHVGARVHHDGKLARLARAVNNVVHLCKRHLEQEPVILLVNVPLHKSSDLVWQGLHEGDGALSPTRARAQCKFVREDNCWLTSASQPTKGQVISRTAPSAIFVLKYSLMQPLQKMCRQTSKRTHCVPFLEVGDERRGRMSTQMDSEAGHNRTHLLLCVAD